MKLQKRTIKSIADIFADASVREYKAGQLLLHQGDPLRRVFYIVKGYIKIYDILETGETRVINLHSPGDAFPLTTFLSKTGTIRYYYETMSDVRLRIMEETQFAEIVDHNHQATALLLEYFAGGYRRMAQHLEAMENKKALDKVTKILGYLIERCGKPFDKNTYKLQLKLTHQDIADLTGLTRETASTQIKILERQGILDQKGGHYLVDKALA